MKAAAFATLTLLASAVCAAPPNEEYSREEGQGRNRGGQTLQQRLEEQQGYYLQQQQLHQQQLHQQQLHQQQLQQQHLQQQHLQQLQQLRQQQLQQQQQHHIPKYVPPSKRTQKSPWINPESQNTIQVIPPPPLGEEKSERYYNHNFSNWDTSPGEHESHDGYETGSSTKTSTDAMIKSLPQVRKGAGEEYVTGALSTCDIIIARIVDASGLSLVELEAEYVPGKGDSETENANKLMFDDTKGKIKLVEERKKLILKSARVNKGN
ncbi:hypothetical protein BASA81_014474 [Batrachochytrium salamandrivorans]|nr:hypothetical protein BASA81_014474 [Batrachochytrium salamandrivorans]